MTGPTPTRTPAVAIGIEVSTEIVRAVGVDGDGSPLWALEVPLSSSGDGALIEAFGQITARFGTDSPVPVRIAWFATGATWQRFDTTDSTHDEVAALADELFTRHDVNASMIRRNDGASQLVGARWDDLGARRLARLAARCGLTGAIVEAAPASMHRVLPPGSTVARRTADASSAWIMLCDDDVPLLATSLLTTRREFPAASAGVAEITLPGATLDQGSILAFASGVVRGDGDATAMERVGDAAGVVAHGAALGALHDGAATNVFTIRRSVEEVARSPWTIEQITVDDDVPTSTWWQRLVSRFRRSTDD